MVKERIQAWALYNRGSLPSNILYYRDGVSSSRYQEVIDIESEGIKTAFDEVAQEIGSDANVKITAVVVIKRHRIASFPPPIANDQDENNDWLPSNLRESVGTESYNSDLYLQPYFALKGTDRPTYYSVLKDDMDLGVEKVQDLVRTF
jgi:eukaryotic translation initiation factor 2C